MWCLYHKTATPNDADCRARPAKRPNIKDHSTQVCPPSVPGTCRSWGLPVQDDSDEKPCISSSVREVQTATDPAEAQVGEEKGTPPSGPVPTAAKEV